MIVEIGGILNNVLIQVYFTLLLKSNYLFVLLIFRNSEFHQFDFLLQWYRQSNKLYDTNSSTWRIFRVRESKKNFIRKLEFVNIFSNYVLRRSDSLDNLGSPHWALTLCLLLAWILVGLCIIQGIKSSGKVNGFIEIVHWIEFEYSRSFILQHYFRMWWSLR